MIDEILRQDFQEKVVVHFCKLHSEIAEVEEVRHACNVILDYCSPIGGDDGRRQTAEKGGS